MPGSSEVISKLACGGSACQSAELHLLVKVNYNIIKAGLKN